MSNRKTTLTVILSVAFLIPALLTFAQIPAPATTAPFKIRTIRQQLLSPPDFHAMITGSGNRSTAMSDKWLRIEVEFDSLPEWADDVQVKYYVLLGTNDRDARMLVGDMTYVNV